MATLPCRTMVESSVVGVTRSVVVHREAVFGVEEFKRIFSLAELSQPFDDGLPYETAIEPTRRSSRPRWRTGIQFATPVRHAGALSVDVTREQRTTGREVTSDGLTQAVSRLALPTPTWRTNCYGHTHRGLQNEPNEECADQMCHKFFPRAHQKLLHHHTRYPLCPPAPRR